MKTAQLIGFENFDDFTVQKVRETVYPLIDRYKRMFGVENIKELKIVAKVLREDGGKDEYEVVGHLSTTHGLFEVKKSGWDVLNVVNEVVSNLVRQITAEKEKILKERTGRNA